MFNPQFSAAEGHDFSSGEECIPGVTPMTLFVNPHYDTNLFEFHLSLLCRFRDLYEFVERASENEKSNVSAVQRFLACAESRYHCYIQLVELLASQNTLRSANAESDEADNFFCEVMPLPPW